MINIFNIYKAAFVFVCIEITVAYFKSEIC